MDLYDVCIFTGSPAVCSPWSRLCATALFFYIFYSFIGVYIKLYFKALDLKWSRSQPVNKSTSMSFSLSFVSCLFKMSTLTGLSLTSRTGWCALNKWTQVIVERTSHMHVWMYRNIASPWSPSPWLPHPIHPHPKLQCVHTLFVEPLNIQRVDLLAFREHWLTDGPTSKHWHFLEHGRLK